jgi:Family of unknown function (DUF6064)
MQLPFSEAQFLDVFQAYNSAFWPIAALAWIVTVLLVLELVRGHGRSRLISLFVALLWAWSGLVYHAILFTRINPAAWLFATLFVAQSLLFVRFGMMTRRLRFEWGSAYRHRFGGFLISYSLLYPALVVMSGHYPPRAPTFGVPCPTVLLTVGLLFAATPPVSRWFLVIPMFWSIMGGSAAFLFGMTPDLMLFVAGGGLVVLFAARRKPTVRRFAQPITDESAAEMNQHA